MTAQALHIEMECRLSRILAFLREQNLPMQIGKLYQVYIDTHEEDFCYATWRRCIKELGDRGFISGKKTHGAFGNSVLILEVLRDDL